MYKFVRQEFVLTFWVALHKYYTIYFIGCTVPDVPGWLGCLVEGSLEDLQLFGLDGCARPASLAW
jgi:hypothetical protein